MRSNPLQPSTNGPSRTRAPRSTALSASLDTNGGPSRIADEAFALEFVHRLRFTRGVFDPSNELLRDLLSLDPESPGRVVAFVDDGLLAANPSVPSDLGAYAAAHRDAFELTGVEPARVAATARRRC
jgi:hypothetical protein